MQALPATNDPTKAKAQLQQQNAQARALVLQKSFPMIQQINAQTLQPAAQNVVSIPPVNVGLLTGFLIRLSALITNPAAGSSLLTLTAQGPANLLQNVIFTDLQNYQRINTSGWHLSALASLRQGSPFESSTPTDSPMGYGSNWPVIKAPTTIATNTSATVYMFYWIPLAYSEDDLTGSIYANVVNATMNLQLTFAQAATAVVSNTSDPTLAVYQGAGAVVGVTITNLTIQVYQYYRDQLPMSDRGPILPPIDLNTMYELKNTVFTALVPAQDFYMQYSNFRHFLSTILIFDNQAAGVYPAAGSDINYFSFRSANATDLRRADPFTWKSIERKLLTTDAPLGMYMFDTRKKPIYTTQVGNMALVVQPSTVNAGCNIPTGWEMLANISNLMNASSLASS